MPRKTPESATICVSSQIGNDPAFGAVTPPLYLSSTYKFAGLDQMGQYDYGRSGNPNRDALATVVAQMEGGAGAAVTSSGMAAIDLALNLVPRNGLVVAPHDCYGGTYRLLEARQKQGRFQVEFINQTSERAVERALDEKPALVLIETPSNPLMRVVDVAGLSKAAHHVGAIVVCDNTFLSPARQLPLALGADIVVHSSTKYINGHSDVVGGIVVAKDEAVLETLTWWANCTGVTGAPFDSFLTLRGLRTLHARMDVQEANAIKIAEFLHAHPQVSKVYYPGLASDPGYALAQRQQSGPGAMLSFELAGSREDVGKFLSDTHVFQLAESLGGTESLICHPASMTHRAMTPEARATAGIGETLIRLSVGLESSSDQLAELKVLFTPISKT
ncbi:MAG: O-succinylhomoserine (thiol)-lyase [Robiginitomaculum sp.]|nr:MAG: O-succinylhomoserine (thiol)-lyase [Robiginitomaculum sp.]